jgi:hypothetical protein
MFRRLVFGIKPVIPHRLQKIVRYVIFIFFLQLLADCFEIFWQTFLQDLGVSHEHVSEDVIAIALVRKLVMWFEVERNIHYDAIQLNLNPWSKDFQTSAQKTPRCGVIICKLPHEVTKPFETNFDILFNCLFVDLLFLCVVRKWNH